MIKLSNKDQEGLKKYSNKQGKIENNFKWRITEAASKNFDNYIPFGDFIYKDGEWYGMEAEDYET